MKRYIAVYRHIATEGLRATEIQATSLKDAKEVAKEQTIITGEKVIRVFTSSNQNSSLENTE